MPKCTLDGFAVYEFLPPQKTFQNAIFFAHANAIPALTYSALFQKIANELGVAVFAYDMRGIGHSAGLMIPTTKSWLWQQLAADHRALFLSIRKQNEEQVRWSFAGHSLGAWIALLAADRENLALSHILLFDPPLFLPKDAFHWMALKILGRTQKMDISQRARRRKVRFSSKQTMLLALRKSELMKKWSETTILDYVEASYMPTGNPANPQYTLRHDPAWEAKLFETYPLTAASGFLTISKKRRHALKPVFFVGERSKACNPKARWWVRSFFPKCQWVSMQEEGHLFPLDSPEKVLTQLKRVFGK